MFRSSQKKQEEIDWSQYSYGESDDDEPTEYAKHVMKHLACFKKEDDGDYNDCKDEYDDGYNEGYDDGNYYGYNDGYNDGYDEGYDDGYDAGYEDGIRAAAEEAEKTAQLDEWRKYFNST